MPLGPIACCGGRPGICAFGGIDSGPGSGPAESRAAAPVPAYDSVAHGKGFGIAFTICVLTFEEFSPYNQFNMLRNGSEPNEAPQPQPRKADPPPLPPFRTAVGAAGDSVPQPGEIWSLGQIRSESSGSIPAKT